MEELVISDTTIEIIRKDIKNIHLAVYPPSGRVRIAAPLRIQRDAIRLFAIAKLPWIRRHQRRFAAQERISPREYRERESHYFQGSRYLLHIHEHEGPGRVEVRNKTSLDLFIHRGSSPAEKHRVMNEWYRSKLKQLVPDLLAHWQQKSGISVGEWRIRQMRTKWGSCNIEKRRIWLNLELAKKPVHCVEYVLVHEMVHLLERHHNDRFRATMDRLLPNWRQLKAELNRLPINRVEVDQV